MPPANPHPGATGATDQATASAMPPPSTRTKKATHPPVGMVDVTGDRAERRQATIRCLQDFFRQANYGPVSTPVLERAEYFIDRIGEDMRSRLYLFTEPGGREICLRPEFTIPTVRLYANQTDSPTIFRGSYCGPVFRYDSDDAATHRQFTQAGVELIGPVDTTAGDVEVLVLASRALEAIGLEGAPIRTNDLAFSADLINSAELSPKWRGQLLAMARSPERLRQFLASPDDTADTFPASARWEFLETLNTLDPADRHGVVEGMVRSLQPDEHFGTRSVEDIVTRTLEQADLADRNRLPDDLVASLLRLTQIKGPIDQALAAVESMANDTASAALAATVARWRTRTELLAQAGISVDTVTLDLSLGRGIDYYTGLVFEVGQRPFAAGGRYDRLVLDLSGTVDTHAVGFAVDLDAVDAALSQRSLDDGRRPAGSGGNGHRPPVDGTPGGSGGSGASGGNSHNLAS